MVAVVFVALGRGVERRGRENRLVVRVTALGVARVARLVRGRGGGLFGTRVPGDGPVFLDSRYADAALAIHGLSPSADALATRGW